MAKTKKTRRPKKHMHIIDTCFDTPPMLVRRRGATFDDLVYWTGLGVIGETMAVKFGAVLDDMALDEIGNMFMANFATAQHVIDSKKRRTADPAGQVPQPAPDEPARGPRRSRARARG